MSVFTSIVFTILNDKFAVVKFDKKAKIWGREFDDKAKNLPEKLRICHFFQE